MATAIAIAMPKLISGVMVLEVMLCGLTVVVGTVVCTVVGTVVVSTVVDADVDALVVEADMVVAMTVVVFIEVLLVVLDELVVVAAAPQFVQIPVPGGEAV